MGLNVLSLFDGISAGQVALERLNIEVDNYFASEIDPYAIQVTQKNYPNTIQLGDITKIKSSDLPEIDLIIGGSPCTGFSVAGKGLNFEDPQSKLFFEYIRLLDECKPKYFLLENVKMKKEWLDKITEIIGVNPILIDSALVSAQRRLRYYWTNIPNITQPKDKGIFLKDILESEVDKKYFISESKVEFMKRNKVNPNFDKVKACTLTASFYKQGKQECLNLIRVGQIGKGGQGQRIYSSEGKSVNLTANGGGQGAKTGLYQINANEVRRLTPKECGKLQNFPDDYALGLSDTRMYQVFGNSWTIDVICHILKNLKENL